MGDGLGSLSTYQINDQNFSATMPEFSDDCRVVTIKRIYTTLVPDTYTLGVNGGGYRIVDWAGNSLGYSRIDFTITEKTDGPIAQGALDPVYPFKVDIEFDNEIQDDTYITWSENNRTYRSSSTTVNSNIATFEFDDTSEHRILPLRLTTITIANAKDYWNNAAQAPLSLDVTPIEDTVGPTIVGSGSDYCNMQSFMDTCRKQGRNPYDMLRVLLSGGDVIEAVFDEEISASIKQMIRLADALACGDEVAAAAAKEGLGPLLTDELAADAAFGRFGVCVDPPPETKKPSSSGPNDKMEAARQILKIAKPPRPSSAHPAILNMDDNIDNMPKIGQRMTRAGPVAI